MANEVFISYSRNDLEKVRRIKEKIDNEVGLNCWMDLDGIESGEQFKKVIISAINRHNTILFMLSANSMKSEWALDELDFARRKQKRIVMVDLDHAEMTDEFYFSYHKYDNIDWSNSEQRNKLLRNLRRWFSDETQIQHSEKKAYKEKKEDEQKLKKEKANKAIDTSETIIAPIEPEYVTEDPRQEIKKTEGEQLHQEETYKEQQEQKSNISIPIIGYAISGFFVVLLIFVFSNYKSGSVDIDSSLKDSISKNESLLWPPLSKEICDFSSFELSDTHTILLDFINSKKLVFEGFSEEGEYKKTIAYNSEDLTKCFILHTTIEGVNPIARMMLARNELNQEYETYSTDTKFAKITDYYQQMRNICEGNLKDEIVPTLTVLIRKNDANIDLDTLISVFKECCIVNYHFVNDHS